MIDEMNSHHLQRHDHNKKNLDRIRRMMGQLESLEHMIEADEGTCEERVIRARTIEKGVTSLITHLVECYIENTARLQMETDPDQAVRDLNRIINLVNDTAPYKPNPERNRRKAEKRRSKNRNHIPEGE
jgi:DNA-binding FrmR family transcriptional regulator